MIRKLAGISATAALLAGLGAMPVSAEGHAANRATGSVEFITGGAKSAIGNGTTTTAVFNAHAPVEMANGKTREAKGTVDVTNHDGVSFVGNVIEVTPGENTMRICGSIATSSGTNTNGNNQGTDFFVMWVEDGGTPGTEGDQIAINRRAVAPNCANETFGPPGQPVEAGNLVVHAS